MTHYGVAQDVRPHFAALLEHLDVVASLVQMSLDRPGTDEERSVAFADELRRELRRTMPEAQVAGYETAAQFHLLWRGLARYWRKKAA
jgi:hypothetical protein